MTPRRSVVKIEIASCNRSSMSGEGEVWRLASASAEAGAELSTTPLPLAGFSVPSVGGVFDEGDEDEVGILCRQPKGSIHLEGSVHLALRPQVPRTPECRTGAS